MTVISETAKDVREVIARHADFVDRERRLPDEVLAALRASGINRLALPAAFGGEQAHPWTLVEAVERIAAVDGSTGWCAAIGAGANVFAGYLPETGARRVFGDPDAGNAGVFAPCGTTVPDGNGGVLLTGRWPLSSYCLHAAWIGLGTFVRDADGVAEREPRLVFVPSDAVTVHDTWDVSGLRGTGSHDTSVDRLSVDLDLSCRFSDAAWPEGPLWRMPLFTVLAPCLTAVLTGVARGALDALALRARDDRGSSSGGLAGDSLAMADLAAADAALRAARAGVQNAVADVWRLAERAEPVSRAAQVRVQMSCGHAADVAVEVTAAAQRLGGSGAVYNRSGLSRALRDVQTGRQHILFNHRHRAAYGRILTGAEEPVLPIIL